jgi:hypothetical protein
MCTAYAVLTRRQPAAAAAVSAVVQQGPVLNGSTQKLRRAVSSAWRRTLSSWSIYGHQLALPAALACGMLHLTVMHMGMHEPLSQSYRVPLQLCLPGRLL